MLTVESLSVRFGRAQALVDLSVALEAAAVHGIVGRNGAGKTTLLEAIYGFVEFEGRIRVGGREPHARDIAYVPTVDRFFPRITGREYLSVFRGRRRGFDPDAWAELFDLPLDRYVDAYSTGMGKKLALLGALSLGRSILMLDEPGNHLDVESNLMLGRLLRVLADEGRTVLVTSHVLESLTGVCDHIHVLAEGRLARSLEREEFDELEGELVRGTARPPIDRIRTLVRALDAPGPPSQRRGVDRQ